MQAIQQLGRGYMAEKPGTYNKGLEQTGEAMAYSPSPLILGSMALKMPKALQGAIKMLNPVKKVLPVIKKALPAGVSDWDMAVDVYRGAKGSMNDMAAARQTIMREAQRQLIPDEMMKYKGNMNKMIDLTQKRIRNEYGN